VDFYPGPRPKGSATGPPYTIYLEPEHNDGTPLWRRPFIMAFGATGLFRAVSGSIRGVPGRLDVMLTAFVTGGGGGGGGGARFLGATPAWMVDQPSPPRGATPTALVTVPMAVYDAHGPGRAGQLDEAEGRRRTENSLAISPSGTAGATL